MLVHAQQKNCVMVRAILSCLSVWISHKITLAAVLIFWGSTAWGATLTWDANTEPDHAGYRVYQCDQLPCSREDGTATSLATLGKVTSFNIGTPAVAQFYVITAHDLTNNESEESNVVTYDPNPDDTSTETKASKRKNTKGGKGWKKVLSGATE